MGCEKGNQGSSTGYISGQVLELGTNTPVSSALITTYPLGITTTTNNKGGFALSPLPIGNYKLIVQAAGYISQTTDFIPVTTSGINNFNLYISQFPATSMVIANAGSNLYSAGYGSVVTLNGNGSSSYNNAPITYQWKQISGPGVMLLSDTTANPVFTTLPINDVVGIPDNFGLLGITPTETGFMYSDFMLMPMDSLIVAL